MLGSSSVHDNSADEGGGGVFVDDDSTFTMRDSSSVRDNSANFGGGVFVDRGSSFTMQDSASVRGNSANEDGGGVAVSGTGGLFIMRDSSSVHGNPAELGGGVLVEYDGTFFISGGTVYGNTAGTMSNTASSGAALFRDGTAQHGTFSGTTFTPIGNLFDTNATIRVVNGVLQ
jgi:hypothetical protein